jgi:hypothetical protein
MRAADRVVVFSSRRRVQEAVDYFNEKFNSPLSLIFETNPGNPAHAAVILIKANGTSSQDRAQ